MRRLYRAAVASAACLAALLVWQPPAVDRALHWANYRLTGIAPPPIVAGRNGRLFLGNHEGGAPRSLLREVCSADTATGPAVAAVGAVLRAGEATGLPFRFLVVPTAPRLYPEDLPRGLDCADPAADRLVASLDDRVLVYPVDAMTAMKARFDVLPRRHFHWAGEGPLRVAEHVADGMGLPRTLTLPLRADNRVSDLNGFYPGLGLHDRVQTPFLRVAGVSQCTGIRCNPRVPAAVVAFTRPGAGRLLVIADSFGDEIGGDFSEYAGQVWLVRMNLAITDPPDLRVFRPDAVVVVYHDAGALALDAASQASLAAAARLLDELRLPAPAVAP